MPSMTLPFCTTKGAEPATPTFRGLAHPVAERTRQKKINDKINPQQLTVKFFNEQQNIRNITCYSNDGGEWKKPELIFEGNNMIVNFNEKLIPRRGRINCSLNDNGKWRWFGTQFTIVKNSK